MKKLLSLFMFIWIWFAFWNNLWLSWNLWIQNNQQLIWTNKNNNTIDLEKIIDNKVLEKSLNLEKEIVEFKNEKLDWWFNCVFILISLLWLVFAVKLVYDFFQTQKLTKQFIDESQFELDKFRKEAEENILSINKRTDTAIEYIKSMLPKQEIVSNKENTPNLNELLSWLLWESQQSVPVKIADNTDPEDYRVWYNIWLNFLKNKEYSKAIESFDKALELNSSDVNIIINKWNAYKDRGYPDKAIEEYEKILLKNKNNYLALMWKGMSLMNKQQYDDSLDIFEYLISVYPNDIRPYLYKWLVYKSQHDFWSQTLEFNKIFDLVNNNLNKDPDNIDLLINKWLLYINKDSKSVDDYNNAKIIFEKILFLDPWNNNAKNWLSDVNLFLDTNISKNTLQSI